jgi:hypothetical protein
MWPRRIEQFIEAIIARLSAIHESIDEQTDARTNEQTTKREDERQKTGVLRSIAQSIETGNNSATAAHQENQRQQGELISVQWWLVWCTAGAFVAASIYAAIAAYQGCLMRRTYTELQQQTAAAQQAAKAACINAQIARNALFVAQAGARDSHNIATASIQQAMASIQAQGAFVVHDIRELRAIPGGGPIQVPFGVKNVGKSDAFGVDFRGYAILLPKDKEPDFSYKHASAAHEGSGILKPEDSTTPSSNPNVAGLHSINVYGEDGVIRNADQPTMESLQALRTHIVVYGRVTYKDSFGIAHWGTFCVDENLTDTRRTYTDYKGAGPKCAAYNDEGIEGGLKYDSTPLTFPPVPDVNCEVPK